MEQAGLYIHVPFCRSKCPYCDFYSLAAGSLIPDWLDAAASEMGLYKGVFGTFDTIYVGGGTPSLLPGPVLEVLMNRLVDHFVFIPETEITIEANPGDLTSERISLLKALGFNRISVGMQSFDDGELAFLGRRHDARGAAEAASRLRRAGFPNVGMDLIYGIPGQDMASWFHTLDTALSFEPRHLSCYQLTIEKGTVFSRRKEKGELVPIGEDLEREFFLRTSEFLTNRGYLHYEVSNFARDPKHICRHNQKYWQHVPYLGLGPSAHSFQAGRRWWNVRSVRGYCRALKAGASPVEGEETLTPAQVHLESVALGLRTQAGFDRSELRDPAAEEMLEKLEATGFLRCDRTRVTPTRKGFLFADHLPLYLCEEGRR
jgi:oxygen-independent coproporphyrinogen III oxidase